ncbi:MAG: hypothetical protein JSV88_23200 [Candidatus Aminicenantes bacterium]|nr:MAG: hypothetical protein JSV88_23200 [Candidatus Aminicenantes bacterium]
MMITVNELKQFAFDRGADLVGVAPVDRFDAAPVGHRPADILPEAAIVVVCAMCIPGGVLEGPATAYHRAMEVIHIRLDQLAVDIALFLEKAGEQAIPVPSASRFARLGPLVKPKWSIRHCAGG